MWGQCLLGAKLASETASCKDLLGHCSTTVSEQLLSRPDTQIARGKTEVSPRHLRTSRFYCKGDRPSGHTFFHAFYRMHAQEDGLEKMRAWLTHSHLDRTGFEPGTTWELPKPGRMRYQSASPNRGPSPHPRTRDSHAPLTLLKPALLT